MSDDSIGLWGDPLWLVIVKAIVAFVIPLTLAIVTVWFERRALGFMQQRRGPNMAGPLGLLQAMADGVKTLFKEDFMPKNADKLVFTLAPLITGLTAFTVWSVLPIGGEVSIAGHTTRLQLGDLPVGVLFILAIASLGTYGIVLAGWASTSRYSLLGGLRAAAQMVSYEVSMGLTVVAVVLLTGSMSTQAIVDKQAEPLVLLGWESPLPAWNFLLLAPAFFIYFVSMIAEANRQPFDEPECESELVGGYGTDYSGFRFAMFYLGEYINMGTLSAISATLFLGGISAPVPLAGTMFDGGWWGMLWFFSKVFLFLFCFIWVRGTIPRYRYDQLMRIGWKTTLPLALGWVGVLATFLKARQLSDATSLLRDDLPLLAVVVGYLALCYFVLFLQRRPRERAAAARPLEYANPDEFYPLPLFESLTGQPGTELRSRVGASAGSRAAAEKRKV